MKRYIRAAYGPDAVEILHNGVLVCPTETIAKSFITPFFSSLNDLYDSDYGEDYITRFMSLNLKVIGQKMIKYFGILLIGKHVIIKSIL